MGKSKKRKAAEAASAAASLAKKQAEKVSIRSKQRRKAGWEDVADFLLEKVPLLRNAKGCIRSLDENKRTVMLVLGRELELALNTPGTNMFGSSPVLLARPPILFVLAIFPHEILTSVGQGESENIYKHKFSRSSCCISI